jgi:beta-glucosidase-like glycosyl hydrolase
MVIRIIEGLLRIRRVQEKMQKPEGSAAAEREREGVAELEAERQEYSPEDQKKIRAIWGKRLEKNPSFNSISNHVNTFFSTASPEQVKAFAFYALKHGYALTADNAEALAKKVAENKALFHGGFDNARAIRALESDAKEAAEKDPSIVNSDEYNFVKLVLAKPKLYSKWIFSVFQQRPPGGVTFPSD